MNDQRCDFPTIPARLPGRLTARQTAALLGFQPHDIPILVAAGLLKPLGGPPPQASRYFFTPEILELAANRQFASKATNALYKHWGRKNHSSGTTESKNELVSAFA